MDANGIRMIGRADKADFPQLGLYNIDIKIDTGAYTSTIHCHRIEEIMRKGRKVIRFSLLDPSHPEYNKKRIIIKNYTKKSIKSSTGHSEERFIINTKIILFKQIYDLELSLTDRTDMKFPILIGRKLLNNNFLVNVAVTNLSYKHKLGV